MNYDDSRRQMVSNISSREISTFIFLGMLLDSIGDWDTSQWSLVETHGDGGSLSRVCSGHTE